jgi:MAGUK p55 subfamily protein 5
VTPVPLQDIPTVPTTTSKPDLLFVEENAPVSTKPLTPAVENNLEYTNPFDTSIANNLLPGRAELKVLESELLSSIKRSYTDPDFNPRAEDVVKVWPSEAEPVTEKPDLLNLPTEVAPNIKTLTPVVENSGNRLDCNTADDIDPFDTSIASDLVPGKAELRLLESELIGQ